MKRPRRLLYGILLVMVAGLGATLFFLSDHLDPAPYQHKVVKTLEAVTGKKISVGGVSFTPSAGVTLRLEQFKVYDNDTNPRPLMEVEALDLGVGLDFLLDKSPTFSSVVMVRPFINLVSDDPEQNPLELLKQDAQRAQRMIQGLFDNLSGFHLGRLEVRDGTIAIHSSQPGRPPLRIDQLLINMLELGPSRESTLRVLGRFQHIPFTITGRVGPLPKNHDLATMPILLNADAKTIEMGRLSDILPNFSNTTQIGRGNFTALVHGSLEKGLNSTINFRLEDLQNLPPVGHEDHEERMPPLDLTLRQKSTLRLHRQALELKIQEFYLYQNGRPLLEISGRATVNRGTSANLTLKSLNPVPVFLLPQGLRQPLALHDGEVTGLLKVQGSYPQRLTLTTELDLTGAAMERLPYVQKAEDLPLTIRSRLLATDLGTQLESLTISQPNSSNIFKLSGALSPTPQLRAVGRWKLEQLAEMFPTLQRWHPQGQAHIELRLNEGKGKRSPFEITGQIRAPEGKLERWPWEKLTLFFDSDLKSHFTINRMQLNMAGGHLSGLAHVRHTDGTPALHAFVSGSGISVEKLQEVVAEQVSLLDRISPTSPPIQRSLRVEGLLFGEGELHVQMDEGAALTPANVLASADLRIEPGQVVGIDGALFLRALLDGSLREKMVAAPQASFAWDTLQTHLLYHQGNLDFKQLQIQAGDLQLRGSGSIHALGKHAFALQLIHPSLLNRDPPPAPLSFKLLGRADTLTVEMPPPQPVSPPQP
ncbi:hypothetical protein Mmc1_0680 [Magnetococcus marinus MC-1]|uniref:AsmA-like C-terminal domain-containing protein n=1 Tax=Magnetococcus marinus (strain ATCC BAA-1437 / JCM 17883 / MC-1) TaxID=156889 RepID=A0L5F8_MAGMM|nr:hypothetical protein [Magnetococcus marinus]ABK43201.1 hypothetical protein Mmc1_0680 [Magnetococcus marinus MC-1]